MTSLPAPVDGAARSEKNSAGVQSIEVGVALLRVLSRAEGPMKLTDLAVGAGLSTSRAHKYLASFIRCGLVRQSGMSNRYGLGPLAAELGFSALRGIDVVELSQEILDELRDQLQTVVSLAIWANRGPTIIRRAIHEQSASLVVQLGGVMNVLTSAGGRVLAAHLDRAATAPFMTAELAAKNALAAKAGLRTMRDVDAMLAEVRASGFAAISGTMLAGIVAASVPVFDYAGKIAAALTLVGLEGQLELDPESRTIRTLRAAAEDLSRRLGAPAVPKDLLPQPPAPRRHGERPPALLKA
jgi:DNA-binding IclR family transcriptional regulator